MKRILLFAVVSCSILAIAWWLYHSAVPSEVILPNSDSSKSNVANKSPGKKKVATTPISRLQKYAIAYMVLTLYKKLKLALRAPKHPLLREPIQKQSRKLLDCLKRLSPDSRATEVTVLMAYVNKHWRGNFELSKDGDPLAALCLKKSMEQVTFPSGEALLKAGLPTSFRVTLRTPETFGAYAKEIAKTSKKSSSDDKDEPDKKKKDDNENHLVSFWKKLQKAKTLSFRPFDSTTCTTMQLYSRSGLVKQRKLSVVFGRRVMTQRVQGDSKDLLIVDSPILMELSAFSEKQYKTGFYFLKQQNRIKTEKVESRIFNRQEQEHCKKRLFGEFKIHEDRLELEGGSLFFSSRVCLTKKLPPPSMEVARTKGRKVYLKPNEVLTLYHEDLCKYPQTRWHSNRVKKEKKK